VNVFLPLVIERTHTPIRSPGKAPAPLFIQTLRPRHQVIEDRIGPAETNAPPLLLVVVYEQIFVSVDKHSL
jgi:hypothetical protein